LSARVPEILGKHYAISYPGQQLESARNLRKTPLHDSWLEHKAHFGQFYGWERPLYFNKQHEPELSFSRPDWFDQVGEEVSQAHNAAAIFDQSTFGKISVSGNDAASFLNRVCSNNMNRPAGRAIYTAMLNERGGFESDLTALRLGENEYRLYVGTNAIKRDLSWLHRHLKVDEKVHIKDETEDFAVLGLMGPESSEIMTKLGADELNQLGYFQYCQSQITGLDIEAVRLSFVGEAGWEITCKADKALQLYEILAKAGAKPAGMLAQSSMRIEKQFLAYGHDLDTDINPFQAGLDFAIDWDSEFIGKQALLALREQQPSSRLASIILDDPQALPLGNEPVYANGKIIGKTTSAAFGYRIGKPIALAQLQTSALQELDGQSVEVDIARSHFSGTISLTAAYDPKGQRMRTHLRDQT
jgi:4-methylaminobutanoate oxidase (formaldehyde-forming)